MADSKISDLPIVTTPTGSEMIPIEVGGANYYMTSAQVANRLSIGSHTQVSFNYYTAMTGDPGLTFDANNRSLIVQGFSNSTPVLSLKQTWNEKDTVYSTLDVNVVNTSSNLLSLLLNVRESNNTIMSVNRDGSGYFKGVVKSFVYTVATLPSASFVGTGSRSFISDSLKVGFNDSVTAGGSNTVPVYSNGVYWLVG